ncbi:MAG: PadR family transcriptional regulator [Defluviitaleaceae bacterium]|nr:PadR family transcriptional regulator [Defluviitaleaceae bacterium]
MEDFILGLLMIHKLTAYEIHKTIKENYNDVCSHSIGNVQRALKILHKKGFVIMNEVLNGKVVKKVYEITSAGRKQFLQWLNSPMLLNKANNIELGKLLLMGFLPPDKRIERLNDLIESLQADLAYLTAIEETVKAQLENFDGSMDEMQSHHIAQHPAYMDELIESVEVKDLEILLADISKFSLTVLRHGLDEAKFNHKWFSQLRDDMIAENKKE